MCISFENKTNVEGTTLFVFRCVDSFQTKNRSCPERSFPRISVVVFTSIVVILRLIVVDVKREVLAHKMLNEWSKEVFFCLRFI